MTTPAAPDLLATRTPEHRGTRRWSDVLVLWVAAVAAQALILFLLAQYQLQQVQAMHAEVVASLIGQEKLEAAAQWAAEPAYLYYPTAALVQFALVGLAVVITAWVGRRPLAWLVPFGVALASIAPAYTSRGPLVPQPISELGDTSLWGALGVAPAQNSVEGVPTWPLLLGVAVQTALLLLPLVAAPMRRAPLSMAVAARRAALPTVAVAILAVATIQYPSTDDLMRMPVAIALVGLLAAGIATGAGSPWLRLPAAVLAPAFVGPFVIPIDTTDALQDAVLGVGVAVGAAVIVLGTLATPWVDAQLAALRHRSGPEVPAAV